MSLKEKFFHGQTMEKTSPLEGSLEYYAAIVDKYLGNVLRGDFSWYARIKKEDEYERQLVALILQLE
jgi:hypothetical protein